MYVPYISNTTVTRSYVPYDLVTVVLLLSDYLSMGQYTILTVNSQAEKVKLNMDKPRADIVNQ